MNPPIRSVGALEEVIAVVRRHQDFVEVFRLMQGRLGLTNAFIDDVGGLVGGHTDKILGPSQSKNWGPTTFDLFCEMFAIEFRVHVDLDAAKRMEDLWEKRRRPAALSQTSRISKKLIEKAKPYVLKDFSAIGNAARTAKLPGKFRSEIARKAGRASGRARRRKSRTLRKRSAPEFDKPCLSRSIDARPARGAPPAD